jgi:hypothetical protein
MATETLRAILVTAPDCYLCEHARQVLARLGCDWPLALQEVTWESPEGMALVRRDGVPFPPALYLDGTFAGYGRLSEGKLRRILRERAGT